MSCRGCDAANAGLSQATALWPNRSTVSDGICASQTHSGQNPNSDHEPDSRGLAHAFDLTHDPAHGCDAHKQADEARKRAKAGQEPRLKYVISNRRIASAESNWEWVPYNGDNPHEHHAHFSIHTAHENDTSPWYQIGGLTMAEVRAVLLAIRNQSRIQQEVTRNQGEMTRDAVEAAARAVISSLRKTIWRAQGHNAKDIDQLDTETEAEFDELLTTLMAAITKEIPIEDPVPDLDDG